MPDKALCLNHVDKTYNPGTVHEKAMFRDFNLSIGQGEFVSVVGSNGSGKTTLLNLICGSIALDAGEITLSGRPIHNLPEHKRSRYIGRVFQDPAKGTCASLTILENMALADNKGAPYNLARGVNRRRIDEYREMLSGLGLGLEANVNQQVGSLSGGQRQALALLIATMTPLELPILDEHTAALDPKSSETVMQLTDRIIRERGLTALMVTHNLKHAIRFGNRILMMHQGGIVLDAADAEKEARSVDDLLKIFAEISVELGN